MTRGLWTNRGSPPYPHGQKESWKACDEVGFVFRKAMLDPVEIRLGRRVDEAGTEGFLTWEVRPFSPKCLRLEEAGLSCPFGL